MIKATLDGSHVERLFTRIEARRDDRVARAGDRVGRPTATPPGDAYGACAELVGRRLASGGFRVEYPRAVGTPGDCDRHPRINVVARIEGSGTGRCVHFNGHIDVVEPGQGWTVDPFAAVVRDGRLYGRGACDMKGGLAAAIVAVESMLDEGMPWPGAIEISGTVDEESGGVGGGASVAAHGQCSAP